MNMETYISEIIGGLLAIAFFVFVLVVLIRLWNTLGHIRKACETFNKREQEREIESIIREKRDSLDS